MSKYYLVGKNVFNLENYSENEKYKFFQCTGKPDKESNNLIDLFDTFVEITSNNSIIIHNKKEFKYDISNDSKLYGALLKEDSIVFVCEYKNGQWYRYEHLR